MEGILWQDVEKSKSIEQKISEAVAHVKAKHKYALSCCLVNEGLSYPECIEGIKIVGVKCIQPTYVLVGRETMKCPKCGDEAKSIGDQKLQKRGKAVFGMVRMFDCPKCGNFVHPDDVGKIEEFLYGKKS